MAKRPVPPKWVTKTDYIRHDSKLESRLCRIEDRVLANTTMLVELKVKVAMKAALLGFLLGAISKYLAALLERLVQ